MGDVMIYASQIEKWWRKEGHTLVLDDLKWILEKDPFPEVLVIGNGASGVLIVPQEVENALREKGLEVIVQKTEEACRTFNQLEGKKRVAGAFHLTC